MLNRARSRDDGDVIRARLRALLAEGERTRGWVPDDDLTGRPPPADEEPDDPDDGPDADPEDADESDVALPASLGRHRAPGRTARLDPGRPGAWALWVAAVLAALAVLGWTWLDRPVVDQVPAASTAAATAAPTTAPAPASNSPEPSGTQAAVVVSVVGQVGSPGLVTLPAGARVADALAAAGGLLPGADPAAVNAAAVLGDGQQIAVGVPGAAAPAGGAPAAAVPGAGSAAGPLDLHSATAADLDALPGIGPVLAQRIVDHRSTNGPFTSVDQLDDVSGIGPAVLADLTDRVRV